MPIWTIIVICIIFALVIGLLLFAENFIKRGKPKQPAQPKEKRPIETPVPPLPASNSNLSDDLDKILKENKEKKEREHAELKEREKSSRLATTGRISEYYERKWRKGEQQHLCSPDCDHDENDEAMLTPTDAAKLIALRDLFDKK